MEKFEIPGWTALLSNGEKFDGGDISSWRTLKSKCDSENLTIRALLRGDEEIDLHQKVISYFIMYDQVTTIFTQLSRTRICFGSFRENGKARLQWEVINSTLGGEDFGNYTEVVKPDNAMWDQISIPVERGKDYEETVKSHIAQRGN